MSDYPSKQDLKEIEELATGFRPKIDELLEKLESIWWMPEWGFLKRPGFTLFRKKCLKLELHTGGWSGNEDIIETLRETHFWNFYWVKTERGGHYYFEIDKEDKSEK